MAFEEIQYLWLLLIVPLFVYGSLQSHKKSHSWLYFFTRERKSSGPYILHTTLLCAAMAAMIVALAQPRIQYEKIYFNRYNIEIAIGIDVSKSMLAEDVVLPSDSRTLFTLPNRLNRARSFVITLLSEFHGERVGGYIFASKGVEIFPFTRDYGFCRYILRHINEAEITLPGSDLGEAIKTGIFMFEVADQFRKRSLSNSKQKVKIILLLSDGEDISADTSSLYEAAHLASERGIKIYTVGIGMGKGVLIPIRSENGTSIVDYYLDEDGAYLKTWRQEDTLQEISRLTGGEYFRISDKNIAKQLIEAVLTDAKTFEQTKSIELVWFEFAPLFLFAGVIFFMLAVCILS